MGRSGLTARQYRVQHLAEMPKNPRFTPRPLRIEILGFPQVQILDVAGPLQVFASANDHCLAAGRPRPYEPVVLADRPLVTTSAGLGLATQEIADAKGPLDTLIVAG